MDGEVERLSEGGEGGGSEVDRLLADVESAFACAARKAAEATRATGRDAGPAERVSASLGAVLDAAAGSPGLAHLCLIEAPGLGSGAVLRREAGLQRFVELIESELRVPGRRAETPLLAEMIVGGVYEVMQRFARSRGAESLPALADDIRRVWLPVLSGDDDATGSSARRSWPPAGS